MPSQANNIPLMRAAIHARYSSDTERESSIDDSVQVYRRHAELQGWEILGVRPDRALSGTSQFRPAFQRMQVDAEARQFDVIIVDALKRHEFQKIAVRLPPDVHECFRRKPNNQSSINSETIRDIRDAMDRQVDCTSADPS